MRKVRGSVPEPGLRRSLWPCLLCLAATLNTASAASLHLPFDFSRSAIGLDVTVKGVKLFMILDTGVDPSVIDLGRADALGIKVNRGGGGEASGFGEARTAQAYPATLSGLAVAGRAFGPIDALAFDMHTMSAQYGRAIDGVLGYSFLAHAILLVDYPDRTLDILDQAADAAPLVRGCGIHWSTELKSYPGDAIPIIPGFRLGAASGSVSLDTGSNGGIALFRRGLDLPGVQAALSARAEAHYAGARGTGMSHTAALGLPVGFGPFTLPPGQTVTFRDAAETADPRVANVGNALFAALKLRMLLDYRARRLTFYGRCG